MLLLLRIAGLILGQVSTIFLNEFFWIIMAIMYFLYKRSAGIEYAMTGLKINILEKLMNATVMGIMAGLVGSLIVTMLGITIEDISSGTRLLDSGLFYIWIIAILLSTISPRYLCFSYAGSIVALASLITGFPRINVSGLLALVGLLHLIESFLIWIDGYNYSVPIFIKRKSGEIVGGFILNKIWPIPLAMLVMGLGTGAGFSSGLIDAASMPGWWPLIKGAGMLRAEGLKYALFTIPVILGYSDLAVSRTPEKRCRDSALRLASYSIILIVLSVISAKLYFVSFIAAAFAPLAHEMLIKISQKEEEEGRPVFGGMGNGVTVLYARADTPAEAMGLEPGDVVESINNVALPDERSLINFLSSYPPYIWLEIKKENGTHKTVEYKDYVKGIGSLGILVVPQDTNIYYEIKENRGMVLKLLDALKRKRNNRNQNKSC